MLKKLLKYDFRSVFKYWWIAAVSSLLLCVVGGACINVLQVERELPAVVDACAIIVLVLSILSLVAFSLLSTILIFVRFYKNFFTDEGYLTFTLPVKRSSLLNSKLIMSVTAIIATLFAIVFNIGAMLCVGFSESIFTAEFWKGIITVFEELIKELGLYLFVYGIEAILILVLAEVFFTLFLYCCITFASIITKKARVITAIGIYYGANSVFSFVVQIFTLFGARGIFERIGAVQESAQYFVFSLVLLGIIMIFAIFCSMLYTFLYWMLDRKLNLA